MPFTFEISRRQKLIAVAALATASVVALGYWYHSRPNTPGERFDAYIERWTKICKNYRASPGDVTCDFLKLKPYDPLATPEGRFAHSIVIPNPVPADSGYRKGMTPKEYFEHLCRTEAGNFIFKTVSDVEGIVQLRKREQATDRELEHLYAMEDPYGYTYAEAESVQSIFVRPNKYEYLDTYDTVDSINSRFIRFYGYDGRTLSSMKKQELIGRHSRFGFTWRGIRRPHDREMGIAGGELIVLDTETMEVLGVRRGYVRSGHINSTGSTIYWPIGQTCPAYEVRGKRNKDFDFVYWFVERVLRPVHDEEKLRGKLSGK